MQAYRRVALVLVLAACGKHGGRRARAVDGGAAEGPEDQPLPRSRITEVVVTDVTPEELRVFALDVAAVKAKVEKAVADSGAFEAATSAAGAPHLLRIEIAAQVGAKEKPKQKGGKPAGPGVVQIAIEATLDPRGDPEILARVARGMVEREFRLEDVEAVKPKVQADVERAAAETLNDLIAEERLRSGDPAEIAAALDGHEPERRTLAIRYAGARRARALVPRLIEFLKDPDPEVRDSAIGALVDIGDERAVKPLTDLGQFKDLDTMRRVLDAIASLGGDEAKSYLELVADGHEDPRIRVLAKQALDRLQRRTSAPH